MKRLLRILLLIVSGLIPPHVFASSDEFPMRARYPDVEIISTADLAKQYNNVVIADVRTRYEFDTLHIKDAVFLPLGSDFGERARALRQTSGNKTLVFYCNGKTCHKSYEAVLLATSARVANVVAFDSGIFDWAKAHPELTVLRGHTPIKPSELISVENFNAHQLAPKVFEERVGTGSIVLDVRDTRQRDTALFPFRERRAQLDDAKKLDAIIEEAKAAHKTLLVYDQVGKQIQWFQYHLESKGVTDYYFMKGGAQGYFDETLGKVVLGDGNKGKN